MQNKMSLQNNMSLDVQYNEPGLVEARDLQQEGQLEHGEVLKDVRSALRVARTMLAGKFNGETGDTVFKPESMYCNVCRDTIARRSS
jgi:hypothetical protein